MSKLKPSMVLCDPTTDVVCVNKAAASVEVMLGGPSEDLK